MSWPAMEGENGAGWIYWCLKEGNPSLYTPQSNFVSTKSATPKNEKYKYDVGYTSLWYSLTGVKIQKEVIFDFIRENQFLSKAIW
jgi:hypothetical protein